MLLQLLLFFLFWLRLDECNYIVHNVSKRVIGGYSAFKGEFPYQVAVLHATDGLICGGSIITKKWVLSAAHCFDRYDETEEFYVLAGTTTLDSGNRHNVSSVIVHEQFKADSLENDLALVKLKDKFCFGATIFSIGLHCNDIDRVIECKALGWGRYTYDSDHPVPKLRFLEMKTVKNARCYDIYLPFAGNIVKESNICARPKEKGKEMSYMDGGGALVYKGKLMGVLSFGILCSKYPSVYAKIPSFHYWILNTIRDNDVLEAYMKMDETPTDCSF